MSFTKISVPIFQKFLEMQVFNDSKEGAVLLDYENYQQAKFMKFLISQNLKIYSEGDLVKSSQWQNQFSENDVISIVKKGREGEWGRMTLESHYELSFKHQNCFEPTPFLIIRDLSGQNTEEGYYSLQIGDLIRLGKMYDFHIFEMKTKEMKVLQTNSLYSKCYELKLNSKKYQCKFCYMEEIQSKETVFLEGICKCQGNICAVHYECLKFWINQNIVKEETHYGIVLKWTKAFECQVCKDIIPMRVSVEGKLMELFELERPEIAYIALEQVNKDKRQCTEIHIIHRFITEPIKIGRAQGCDIKSNDITVSRHHASIHCLNGSFFLSDNKSKFGTLIALNSNNNGYFRVKSEPAAMQELSYESCAFQTGKYIIKIQQKDQNQINMIYRTSPPTQHKLTQLPQINQKIDEDEPQMDDDSFQEDFK